MSFRRISSRVGFIAFLLVGILSPFQVLGIDFKLPGGIKGDISSGKTLNLKLNKTGKYKFLVEIQNPVRHRPGAEAWLNYDVSSLLEELEIKIFNSKNTEIINNDYVEPVRKGRYGEATDNNYKPPKRITRFETILIATESYRLVFKPMVNALKNEKYILRAKFEPLAPRYYGLTLEDWLAIIGIVVCFGILTFFWKVAKYAQPLVEKQKEALANSQLKENGIDAESGEQSLASENEAESSESNEEVELFCPKCGTKREDDGAFCGDCGYKFK